MPVAAPNKTWEHDPNKVVGVSGELTHKTQMWNMVTSMIDGGIFTTPWIVRGSSDSTLGAMDGVNRWGSTSDIIATNTLNDPHSWIVLEQSGINFSGAANPLQLLCTMNGGTYANPYGWRSFVISPRDGFTGGSGALDPTATDQWGPYWRQSFTNTDAIVQTVSMSSDGEITRIIIGNGSNVANRWLSIETPRNPHPNWETPVVFMTKGSGDFARGEYWTTNVNDIGNDDKGVRFLNKEGAPVGEDDPALYAKHGRALLAQWMAGGQIVVRNSGGGLHTLHDVGGEYNTTPAWIFCHSIGHEGVWGEVEDFYFIGSGAAAGDAIPGSGEKTWWCLGGIIVPGMNDSATDIIL